MNKNFNFFTVSIFCDCDYKDIVSAIYQIKKTQIESNKIEIREEKSIIEEYYNPPSGGAHLPQFTCWESEKYPNKVFFISNYEDGLYTLCKAIHRIVGKILIICSKVSKIGKVICQVLNGQATLTQTATHLIRAICAR